MSERKLGRLPDPEVAHARVLYPMHLALKAAPPAPDSRFWATGPVLDQGQTSACVGFAWEAWLMARPVRTMDGPRPEAMYALAQERDPWAPAAHDGSTVRAGAAAVVSLGRMASYVWASSVDDIRRFVLTQGPVVVGTDWYRQMFRPDAKGYVHPSGEVAGGHAWTIIGYSASREAFRALNSWGEGWGQRGRFWITTADMATLLQGGEACAAVEQALAPVTP